MCAKRLKDSAKRETDNETQRRKGDPYGATAPAITTSFLGGDLWRIGLLNALSSLKALSGEEASRGTRSHEAFLVGVFLTGIHSAIPY